MCDRFLYDKVETLRVIKDCIEGLPKSICEWLYVFYTLSLTDSMVRIPPQSCFLL